MAFYSNLFSIYELNCLITVLNFFISLDKNASSSIHVIPNGLTFISLNGRIILHWIYIPHLLYPVIYLGLFHILTVLNNSTIISGCKHFSNKYVYLFDKCLVVVWVDHMIFPLLFLRNLHWFLLETALTFLSAMLVFPLLLHSHQFFQSFWYWSFFWVWKYYLIAYRF